MYENKKNTFKNIHVNFPTMLAKKCSEYKLKQFIHISALGIEKALDSKYACSKLEGEKNIINYFPKSTILKPSIIFSVDDNFSCSFNIIKFTIFLYIITLKQNFLNACIWNVWVLKCNR